MLKPRLENFEYYFVSMWDECNCAVVWTVFGIAFLWNRMKTDLFLSATLMSYGHCWICQGNILLFVTNFPGQNTGVGKVTFSFSRESSQPRDWTQVSFIAGGFFTSWATREALGHLSKMNSSNPWTRNIFPFCMSSSVSSINVLNSSQCRGLSSSVKFIPRCFVLFDAVVNKIVFLISLSDSLLLMYRNITGFCMFILNNTLHSLTI